MKHSVHGKIIEWEEWTELGHCSDLDKGPVETRYTCSYSERIIKVANDMPKDKAYKGIENMLKRATEQVGHKTLEHLPRFKKGIENSVEFYTLLVKTLE